jgi:hypothetical protein
MEPTVPSLLVVAKFSSLLVTGKFSSLAPVVRNSGPSSVIDSKLNHTRWGKVPGLLISLLRNSRTSCQMDDQRQLFPFCLVEPSDQQRSDLPPAKQEMQT